MFTFRKFIPEFFRATAVILALSWVPSTSASETDSDGRQQRGFELPEERLAQCRKLGEGDTARINPRLIAFTNAEIMSRMLADPVEAAQLFEAVMDPNSLRAMLACGTEPATWDTWMNGMTDMEGLMRAAAPFMNPATYMRWAMAPMNPEFHQPFTRMASPQTATNWMTALSNSSFYKPMLAVTDPSWYTPRIAWMTNPESYRPLFEFMSHYGRGQAPR